jgi:hypothetical protein
MQSHIIGDGFDGSCRADAAVAGVADEAILLLQQVDQ